MSAAAGRCPAFGAPVLSARMRVSVEDFRVEEIDGFEAGGEGEHLLLAVEKRGMNTVFAARAIARWAGVPDHAVGYAGLKDRHAVARQRFSVHLPGREPPDVAALEQDGLRVLARSRHRRKLPRGALAGNRFVLTLREVEGMRDAIEARLAAIAARGVPNLFGEQRFGRGGGNVGKALAMFAQGGRGKRPGREQRSMLLSAARSVLFNRALAVRVADGHWERGLEGEVWLLAGSRSVFGPEPWSEALQARLEAFDIHPSGPLWGRGELRSEGACRELELAALADAESLALRDGLECAGLEQERRALRVRPEGLAWEWPEAGSLRLAFALPPGSYATAVLDQLGEVVDAADADASGLAPA
ncbi:tRNA pseudouridine(13) synthase TruD [Pseudoxanthomonas broegbernensis]|uniref:tRNA pseudouridine synthase D n=1 Tax=Pseudoxanthomonas broegbernensis TaxID=83619 RepID=A0A7V8GM51_9GAMM|nr:tRNA pseudouridine(13) synthase TruD [Pseudoxanthomonas broegbernensis]KAF1686288.1 tRNA pseudouridine(13) synthase TruD [Pseudoxanthomonas broegbernensis]MBB6063972.1 tRNA pseudouridine13 synthase [Pseudoxanthomonas broegbernensis]